MALCAVGAGDGEGVDYGGEDGGGAFVCEGSEGFGGEGGGGFDGGEEDGGFGRAGEFDVRGDGVVSGFGLQEED